MIQGDAEGTVGEGTSVESGSARLPCSNVANDIARALEALEIGRLDVARAVLSELLRTIEEDRQRK